MSSIYGYCIVCGNRGRIEVDGDETNVCSNCGAAFRADLRKEVGNDADL